MATNNVPISFQGLFLKARPSNRTVIVFLLISTLILPTILLYPFSGDNEIWQWIGTVFIWYGGLPYVAAWDNDFPAIMIVHAVAIYFLGNTAVAFRFVEYVAILFTLVALYRTSRLWLSEAEAILGCTIVSLYYVYGRTDCMGMRDNFAVLPIVLSCFYFIRASRPMTAIRNDSRSSNWLIVVGGSMVGIACCIRPTYVLLLIVPILTLYGIKNLRAMILVLVGFLIPVLLMLVPFANTPGGLRQAYICTIRYNAEIYSNFPPSAAQIHHFLNGLLAIRILMVFALVFGWAIVYGVHRMRNIHTSVVIGRERSFLVLFFAALLVGMFSQMMNLAAAHFAAFYDCFIIVMTKMLSDETRALGRWRPAILAAIVVILASVLYPWSLVSAFIGGPFSLEAAYRHFPESFRLDKENSSIASFLTQHTKPTDYIEVIGDPGTCLRTPRRKSTRFQGQWTFLFTDKSNHNTDFQREWRKEFLDSIRHTAPPYIVIWRDPGETERTLYNWSFDRTPEITDFIHEHYILDTLLVRHSIYVRR